MAPGRHQTIANIIPPSSTSSFNVLPEAGLTTKKKGRGPSRGVGLDRLLQAGERIHISFTEEEGRPICNHYSRFANEIGVAVNLFSPIQYESWGVILDEEKKVVFERLLTKPHILNYVNSSMAERYSDHRYNCHKHFKKYATPSEARRHAYRKISQQDWAWLCNHFESDEFKERARKNVGNRKKLKYNHRGGSLSFLGHREKNIKKGWSNAEAQHDYETIKEMEQEHVAEDSTPLSPKEIVELLVGKNFRGFGFRPTLPTSGSRTSSQVENEMRGIIDSQAKELESTRNELESTRTELGKTCDELKKCQTELTDTRAIVDKQQEHMNKQQERLDRIEKFLFTDP